MRIKDLDTMEVSTLHWRKLIFVIGLHCSSFPAFSAPSKRLLLCFQSSAYSLSRSYSKNAFTFLHKKGYQLTLRQEKVSWSPVLP